MDYKIKNLYDKVYTSFIRGEYSGKPKIPTKSEVISKIEEITTQEYSPITTYSDMKDIDINHVIKTFSTTIDDIDVLFRSVESESRDVLDQLTYSLKEHNGVKRELRRIKSSVNDISDGNLGEEYVKYNFTESFENTNNINVLKSDPINFEAGVFSIRNDATNILSLNHYKGTKLEFSIVENYSKIKEQAYVGSTDASTILDQSDPRQLIYKITTNKPSRIRNSFALQLRPDSREVEINSVSIDVDSDISKGYIRLYYRSDYKWKDVPTSSIQEIKSNSVIFNFTEIKCSHIKVEFIKDNPDVYDSNTYFYIINNIAISKSTTKKKSILYSKPITVTNYSNETAIITNIHASGDMEIPKDCDIKLYVAQDSIISGAFLDSDDSVVNYNSPQAYVFDQSYSGTVFLSELWDAEDTISGVSSYKGLDLNWKPLQVYGSNKQTISHIVEFENTKKHNSIENSLFNVTSPFLYGDSTYTGLYDLSGWVNIDNENWDTLSGYVDSGVYVSGVDVATALGIDWEDIEISGYIDSGILADVRYSGQWIGYGSGVGYPFGYYLPSTERTVRFGEYNTAVNGWWRPYSFAVTPTGIDTEYSNGINLSGDFISSNPDFNFNNIPFYKIYKFNYNDTIIDPTIRLYTYQERPINNDNDYYPCNFVWKYRSQWIDQIGYKTNVYDSRIDDGTTITDWTDYNIDIPTSNIQINEEYVVDAISEVKINGTNSILEDREYQINKTDGIVTSINLSALNTTRSTLNPTGVTFDYKYKYRIKNEYLSTWSSYIIISTGATNPYLQIPNVPVKGKENINVINKIDIEDLGTGVIKTYKEDAGVFKINFNIDNDLNGNQHYKLTMYCASDVNTGFCANGWVPYESSNQKDQTIIVSPNIKIVQKINSLKIVDISDLIYDTPMNNDNRAAIIKMDNNEKYLVAKKPSKDIFPGYYFDSLNKKYVSNSDYMIENIGHYVRRGITFASGAYTDEITYTTGSSGLYVYMKDKVTKDTTWNNGNILMDYHNTRSEYFANHSTLGYPINIDLDNNQTFILRSGMYDPIAPDDSGIVGSDEWKDWVSNTPIDGRDLATYNSQEYLEVSTLNRGFLFYSSAENLPSYYSISYRTVPNIDDTNTRFLYKLELNSDNEGSLVPKVKSLRFIINGNE